MDTDADHALWIVNVNMETRGSSETAALPGAQYDDLAVQAYVREIEFRRAISNQLRVGLYESDRSTQTDVSEVVEIKELTSVVQSLTQSLDTLKKEVVLQKNVLQAEYNQKIEAQALELYNRMNDTVRDLEMVHKKKVSTLRRSFQQQLIDALAVIRSKYENHYNANSDLLKSVDSHADSAKIQELRRKIIEKDLVIQSLEAQISEIVENEPPKQIIYQSEDDLEKEKLQEENMELKEKMHSLQGRVYQLETAIKEKDKHIQSLDLDVGAMRVRMEEDQRTIEKLSSDQEQLKVELENEKSAATTLIQQQKEDMENTLKAKLAEKDEEKENVTSTDLHCPFKGIEESKLSVNRKIVREYLANINEFKSPGPDELHPRVLKEIGEEILEPLSIIFENSWRTGEVPEDWRRANVVPIFKKGKKVDPGNYRPQAQLQKKKEEKALLEIQRQKQELLLEEERLNKMKEKLETPKVDVNSVNTDRERLQAQIAKLLSVHEDDAKTIERLQKELERLNKTWEKKFDILKQSFHAIKDEMFLRQSLHRQAMNLHRVSVSYMTDGALGAAATDLPVRNNSFLPSMPLPQIGEKPPAVVTRAEYPSNLMDASEQDVFTENELQVVSDTEEDLEGVPPLPPPPPDRTRENKVKQL
ncbi:uncharacterized protein C10orf67 homolog, mitochondrial isoform X1 [Phyllobates terribilis]|uniref:uncharacterized protein C10orf67 homolog, mitochondrial isoform X1 n=1 Tax=Phyllobates terribilis TaxID=111132 RepID=UPI003CCB60FA